MTPGDRRYDAETRQRLDDLESHYAAERTRLRRITRGLMVVVAVLTVSTVIAYVGIHDVGARQTRDQRDGRRAAVQITCGAISGVIEAGRETILSSTKGKHDTPFERRLEALGYPPRTVRKAQAMAAAAAYARSIASSVRDAADGKARGVVKRNGSLDCDKLVAVARAK